MERPLKKIRVTIDIDSESDESEVMSILLDALSEFKGNRGDGNAQSYVAKRYPTTEGYAWLNREEKIREVSRRCETAMQLRNKVQIEKV